jgi:MOSC domain-containing protein
VRARVSHLWRHPIKGHGVEPVTAVTLAAGAAIPWDRVWAIAHEAARAAPGSTAWVPCANFSRGAKSPELMAIRARVDEAAGTVTLTHPRRDHLTVNPDLPADAGRLLAWVAPLADPGRARPAFVLRADRGMTDSDFPSISILNRASLAALGDRLGRPLAMERFRGNVWLDGLAPFAEFDLVGGELRLGGALLSVRERITRCTATTVDPETGVSDADTLGALDAGWGHQDFGVYAEVLEGGRVAVGDPAVA